MTVTGLERTTEGGTGGFLGLVCKAFGLDDPATPSLGASPFFFLICMAPRLPRKGPPPGPLTPCVFTPRVTWILTK